MIYSINQYVIRHSFLSDYACHSDQDINSSFPRIRDSANFLSCNLRHKSKFNIQFIFSSGLRYEWPGAVLTATNKSESSYFCKGIKAILMLRYAVQCSGPPSVYKNRTGGTFSIDPYLDRIILAISITLCKQDDGKVELIFRSTHGWPWYHDFSTISGISFKSTTSWLPMWNVSFKPTNTCFPHGSAGKR